MDENFLLTTPLSVKLYHGCAKHLPLIDYHNHLAYGDILHHRAYGNLTELWLASDPYKHRVMRMCGVKEAYITGEAGPYEKFEAWCSVFPRLIGHPLHHWSRMELVQVLGIRDALCPQNAKGIWDEANRKLAMPEYSARGIFDSFSIEYCAPCCSLTDDVTPFEGLSHMSPSFRGDGAVCPAPGDIQAMEEFSGIRIRRFSDWKAAVAMKLDRLHAAGCRFADHALDDGFRYCRDEGDIEHSFSGLADGRTADEADRPRMASAMLRFLGAEYAKRGWVMQLHLGALRETSTRLRRAAGAAGGYAGIGTAFSVRDVTQLLDDIEQGAAGLPRVILYTMNPADNAALSVLGGSYARDGVSGLIQQGPAWWWTDHRQGIRDVLEAACAYGILSNFIGMTTDSRSLLSFVRHEYFRRVLCGWIGEKAEKGEFPDSYDELADLVTRVCYTNAKSVLTEGDAYTSPGAVT